MAAPGQHSLDKGNAVHLLAAVFQLEGDKHGQMLKSLQVLRQPHWPFCALHVPVAFRAPTDMKSQDMFEDQQCQSSVLLSWLC